MRLASYAFMTVFAVTVGSGPAVADEQTKTGENAPQPTVMSDAQLDQIVGGISVQNKLVNIWSEHDVWGAGDGKAWVHLQNALFQVPTEE